MSDRLQRIATRVLGVLVIALVASMTFAQFERAQALREQRASAREAREVDAALNAASNNVDEADRNTIDAGAFAPRMPRMPRLPADDEDSGTDLSGEADEGRSIPSNAPRSVRIGVILVPFAGSEGAPLTAPSKRDALEAAERARTEAEADFKAAVRAAGVGSSEDIGRIPRGVLDPRTERAVFSLERGELSSVIETPRGYWIVKRFE